MPIKPLAVVRITKSAHSYKILTALGAGTQNCPLSEVAPTKDGGTEQSDSCYDAQMSSLQ